MKVIFENENEKKFVSDDGDQMLIRFGENGEPGSCMMLFVEEQRARAELPKLFEKAGTLPDDCYYDEMVRLFPEYQNEERLSEKQIQDLLIEKCGCFMIDGRHAILCAEEYWGIKVGEDYKLPDGLSPRQFHLKMFYDFGCEEYLRIFDRRQEKSVEPAYMWAWQNLHFKNYAPEAAREQLAGVLSELKRLNPQLEKLEINEQSLLSLHNAINGVMYGFPAADIEFFCNEQEKGVLCSKDHESRVQRDLAENGLPPFTLMWLPTTETIVELGRRYREKQQA